MDDRRLSSSFRGTDRFQVLRRVGAGAMGVVYEVLDRDTQTRVALKTLSQPTAELLARLKREFRALQDLQHPNLVSLGELHEDEGQWFFTMELVAGVGFLEWVRPAQLDLARLRDALGQLTRALLVLHDAGKVHRDVKPSNVMVTPEGRVVLLDFGLVTEVAAHVSHEGQVVGTAAYMSPEQAASLPVGPEADWYAVGAVLYEALTGKPPHVGPPLQILMDKQRVVPASPRALHPELPEDLDALCMGLLQFEPAARPTGGAVLRRLGQKAPAGTLTMSQAALFVGREPELATLEQAFAEVRGGRALAVMVGGESGVGKSALVRRFTENMAARDPRVLVLAGRCYEREAVPYKAVDGVMEALGRHLQQRLPRGSLLPRRARLLTQVFHGLHAVDALMDLPAQIVPDPQELRTRMFAGARELLADLAARQPMIVVIDDLQWADADSLALLGELSRPPEAPPLLLLCTWRAAGEDAAVVRQRLELPGDTRALDLTPLAAVAARELAVELLGRAGRASSRADAIAREAGGHPLFIDELVRHGGDAPVKLEDALWARIAGLDPAARRVLEILSLADSPVEQEVAARASGLGVGELRRHAGLLRVANLARTGGIRATDTMEPFHDRVRETVIAHLGPDERRALHRELARAMERTGRAAPDALAVQFRVAGEPETAARYAAQAAVQSSAALAFDRAAEFYRMALELGSSEPSLRLQLADALAQAGRGAEAARVYQEAAVAAPAAEQLDLRRRAAQQFLISGHIDEGFAAMKDVLASDGLRVPRTPRRAVARAVWQRFLLSLRGLGFRRRHASELSERELGRIDFCWHAGIGLGMGDQVRGAAFNTQGVILALRAGEPFRIVRALVLEVAYA